MASNYLILPGQSFVLHDGTVLHGGELIALDDDVAAVNRHRVTPVPAADDAVGAAANSAAHDVGTPTD